MSLNSMDEYWVPEHVKEYLRGLGFVLPLDDMEPWIRSWDDWMGARGDFYDYRDKDGLGRVYEVHRRSIHPAMRVCKEWGSLLLNEDVKVVCEDQRATDWIGEFFSSTNFMAQAQATVVRAFGLGTGAWALWVDLDRKKVRIRHYDARMVIPLTWDEDGVTECAFVTRAFYRGKAVDQLQMHLRGGAGFSADSSSPSKSSPEHPDGLLAMESDGTYRIVTVCFDHEASHRDCPYSTTHSPVTRLLENGLLSTDAPQKSPLKSRLSIHGDTIMPKRKRSCMDEQIKGVITRAVQDASRYPFLFVGSGLSRRYTGAPDWEGLLSEVCEEVLENPYAYAGYKSRARIAVKNNESEAELPLVATLMENDVNQVLFSNDAFRNFRNRHTNELTGEASPLKIYVADKIADYEMESSGETEKLAEAGKEKVAGIITTNYDRMCEALFPEFTTYVGESDLLFSDQAYSQEIYKIHGSVTRPGSIVLTSADYAEFAQKRKYLSAKLLTLFVEYPVIFLGYSIQDENIRTILGDICECLPDDKLGRLSRRLIFVQHANDTSVGELAMNFGGRTLAMTKIATDDFESIYDALLASRRMYSTKFIRELRGSVFRLAERIDPTSDVVVSGIDNVLNNLDPEQKIVIGLSVSPTSIGRPISPEDIFEDVVLDNLHYDPKFIVENYLNMFVRRNPNNMPVFKYTRELSGDVVGKDIAAYLPTLTSVDSYRSNTMRKSMPSTRRRFEASLSVMGIAEACAPNSPFPFIPCLEEDEIGVDDLEKVLKQALIDVEGDQAAKKKLLKDSNFRKCIRIYDFLRYGK